MRVSWEVYNKQINLFEILYDLQSPFILLKGGFLSIHMGSPKAQEEKQTTFCRTLVVFQNLLLLFSQSRKWYSVLLPQNGFLSY